MAAAASAQVVLLFPLALLVRPNAGPGGAAAAAAAGVVEAWKRARTALPEAPAEPLLALAKHLLAESSSGPSDEGNPPPPDSPVQLLLRLIEAEAEPEAPKDSREAPAQPMNHHLSPSPLPKVANQQHRGGSAAAPQPDAPTDPLGPSLPAPAPSSGPRQMLLGSSGSAPLIDVMAGGGGDSVERQKQEQQREERGNGGPGGLSRASTLSAATLLGPARGAHRQLPPPLCQMTPPASIIFS